MPQTFVNPYTPQTPIGAGLQNIAAALFSGPSPYDLAARRAKADLDAAHTELYRANAAKVRGETAAREQATADLASAPSRIAGQIFGNQPAADLWLAARRGGGAPVVGFDMPDAEAGPMPAAPAPVPLQVDPNRAAQAARVLTALEVARGLPGNDNAAQLAKIVEGLFNDEIRQGALAGTVGTPAVQRVGAASAAVEGKPIYDQGQFGGMNKFTGEFQDPRLFNAATALTGAKKDTEVAHAGAYRAQAGASSAHAKLFDAQRGEIGRLVDVQGDDGTVYKVPEDKAGLEVLRNRGRIERDDNRSVNDIVRDGERPQRGGAAKDAPKVSAKDIKEAMEKLADGRKLDPGFAMELATRAGQVAQDRKSPYFNNFYGATKSVWDEMTGGTDIEDNTGSWMGSNKRFAPKGYKPGATPAPASAPAGAAPARPAPAPAAGPGAADPVLKEAEDAIRRGAPREKVIERLKKLGYTVKDA